VKSLLLALLVCALSTAFAAAPVSVGVADPYLELRTGPGRGYPITNVVPRGEEVTILKRRTDWFKVRGPRGREGWAHRDQIARTLTSTGTAFQTEDPGTEQFGDRRHEADVPAGH